MLSRGIMEGSDKIKFILIIVLLLTMCHYYINENFSINYKRVFYFKSFNDSNGQLDTDFDRRNVTIKKTGNFSMSLCPKIPPSLQGRIKAWLDAPDFTDLRRLFPFVEYGGHNKPINCIARDRVAIIIPYRDRDSHLRIILHNLHSLLTRQLLDYQIFIIEQHGNETFNRAKLLNVGYAEAVNIYDWQCFIFHDVDLIPEDDRNLYNCPQSPRHMSVAIDKFKYKLPYSTIFGGICALTNEQYLKVNGFSNDFWGWGGEDDDIYQRLRLAGYKISRYSPEIARYTMLKHLNEKGNGLNKCRFHLLGATKTRWPLSGYSSLKYSILSREKLPLYTHIKVYLHEKESRKELVGEGFTDCL